MVRSTSSQPRISVKRRGSKRHAAEAEYWTDIEAPGQDRDDRDNPSLDPARDGKGRGALAQ